MYALNKEFLNNLLTYLGNKPYIEVAGFVKGIESAQPVNILPPVAAPEDVPKVEATTECDTTQSEEETNA